MDVVTGGIPVTGGTNRASTGTAMLATTPNPAAAMIRD
jgi:hypothetical protein